MQLAGKCAAGITAAVTLGSLFTAAPAQAGDTFWFTNNGPTNLSLNLSPQTSGCMVSGFFPGWPSTPQIAYAGQTYSTELNWNPFTWGQCAGLNYTATGGPVNIASASSDFTFEARDPEFGGAWIQACTLSGVSAASMLTGINGLTCILDSLPGSTPLFAPTVRPIANRGASLSTMVRFGSSAAALRGKTAYTLLARYGSDETGQERVVVRTPSGRVLGRSTVKLTVGTPSLVKIKLPAKFSSTVTKKHERKVKIKVRHADRTKGAGETATLVLTRSPELYSDHKYPIAK